MSELNELYQEIILDHNKKPRNFYCMDNCSHHADGYNPLCGDRYKIFLKLENDTITKISFQGEGCAISKSSASIMTELLDGTKIEFAKNLIQEFQDMLLTDNKIEIDFDSNLGKATVLLGVKEFPTRLKCATLAWHAAKAALENESTISTE